MGEFITIRKSDKRKIDFGSGLSNYSWGDFHVGESYKDNEDFQLSLDIMYAIDIITNYYHIPKVRLTSTRRTVAYNNTLINKSEVSASKTSAHLEGKAIDFSFLNTTAIINGTVLHLQYKKDINSKGTLYQALYALGVREFRFYPTWNHIALATSGEVKDYTYDVSDINKEQITAQKIDQDKRKSLPISKEFYEYYHQDSSVKTVSELFETTNSVISYSSMSAADFVKYSSAEKSNLDRMWELYSDEQKSKFSAEYKATTDEAKRKFIKPVFDPKIDYEINVGTLLSIPKSKANIETITAIGSDLFLKQQDLKTFMYDEFTALVNDSSYVPTNKVKIKNAAYSVNYLNITFSCWLYVRSLDKILNISPFVKSMDTVVADGGGTFTVSLNDIMDLNSLEKHAESFYSYTQKTVGDKYNPSYFKKIIQQNDIIFIRFERLDIESDRKDDNNNLDLFIDKSELPNKVYDMIGLVDRCSETYSANTNVAMINFSGRDFTKMIVEDGAYFIPFAMVNGGKEFFLNYNPSDSVFKRLFAGGEFMSLFTSVHRSIRDSVGFIFNQLTNVGVLPKNRNIFSAYEKSKNRLTGEDEDRTSKVMEISTTNKDYLNTVETNGVWKIIKVLIDHQLDDRRLNNGELSSPEGTISDLIRKICQDPFVEFWGDTMGDQFVFIARQPPFTRKQIQNYFEENKESTINLTITADQVSDLNLDWDDTYYTWYQLQPLAGLFGSDQFIAGTAMPIVYFEEYANLFGMHKKVVSDAYITAGVLSGAQQKTNVDLFRQSLANDLQFVIESSAILPFTRKGTITIVGGDRRIKKGMWVIFEPTDEIFYVRSVAHSVAVSGDVLSRTTTLNVERGMKKDYVIGRSPKQIDEKNINYFDIVNMDVILNNLQIKLADDKVKTSTSTSNQQLVNPKLFEFFSTRQQW